MNDNRHACTIERALPCKVVADILGFHVSTIYRMVQQGELDACGEKRRLRVYESSIERYRKINVYDRKKETVVRERFRVTGNRHNTAMAELEELLS